MKKSILFLGILLALFACNNTPKPEKENTSQEPTAPVTVSEAIRLISDSIAMDSTNARLYVSRAKAYFANEQIGQAMIDINKSLQLDSKNIDTYLLLADVYYALGDQDNIASTLNRAVEINSLDARPLVKLAELNLLQQNFNLAIGYVDKALGLSSYNPRAYFVKGMCYMAAKQDTANALLRNKMQGFMTPLNRFVASMPCNSHLTRLTISVRHNSSSLTSLRHAMSWHYMCKATVHPRRLCCTMTRF